MLCRIPTFRIVIGLNPVFFLNFEADERSVPHGPVAWQARMGEKIENFLL